MQFTHVFAIGNIDEKKSSSSLCMNCTEGVGEKPMAGTTEAPVAKAKIFCSLDGPSSSAHKTKHHKEVAIEYIQKGVTYLQHPGDSLSRMWQLFPQQLSCCSPLGTGGCWRDSPSDQPSSRMADSRKGDEKSLGDSWFFVEPQELSVLHKTWKWDRILDIVECFLSAKKSALVHFVYSLIILITTYWYWIPVKWALNPVNDLKHDNVLHQQIPVS